MYKKHKIDYKISREMHDKVKLDYKWTTFDWRTHLFYCNYCADKLIICIAKVTKYEMYLHQQMHRKNGDYE